MKRCKRWVNAAGLLLSLGLLLFPSVAQAAGPEPRLTLEAPEQAELGETLTLRATLLAPDGSPIPGAEIRFLSPTSFLSTSREMLLGEATTDAAGVALFSYEVRESEQTLFIARFAGTPEYAATEVAATVAVVGLAQLYQEEAGIRVPGVGVWLLATILGAVWSVYFTVFVLVSQIARDGPRPTLAGAREWSHD